jgi:predicted nucleic acid-binding protein
MVRPSTLAEVLNRPPWMRRHPVVVDANALIEDVLRRTRSDFSAMTFLGRELASLVAPTYIDAEVLEHLPDVAEQTGCSVALAVSVYEQVHRPLVRFVEMPMLSGDARVHTVARADRDDAQLAHLATLLAPAIVLTKDRHLTNAGIGDPDWLTTLHLLGELAELDAMLWGGSRAAWLSLYLPGLVVGAVGRQIARSEVMLGITVGILVGALMYYRPQIRAAAAEAWTRIEPFVETLMASTADAMLKREQAERALSVRLIAPTTPVAVVGRTARLLAGHREPVASEQIHDRLLRRGHEISLAATRTMLRNHPAFVSVRGRGYQLGRSLGGANKAQTSATPLQDIVLARIHPILAQQSQMSGATTPHNTPEMG